jgi:hypothetical protein
MFSPLDVIKFDFLVVDVLELNVSGERQLVYSTDS